jgi:hypothetical protein
MHELILLIKIFHFVAKCYGFWTSMLLLEGVLFIVREKPKLIQR